MAFKDVGACGARTRIGGSCRQPRMPNGRCRMHGGKTPRGIANPNAKTGRYSKDLPTRLLARYEDLMTDGTLLSMRNDIALLCAAIGDKLGEIKAAEANPDIEQVIASIEAISENWRTWDYTRMDRELAALLDAAKGRQAREQAMGRVRMLIRDKAELVAQENKLLADRDAMIPVDQVILLMRAIAGVIRREVRDPDMLRAIEAEFTRIVGSGEQALPRARRS